MRLRLLIGAVGVALGVFGIFRLLTQVPLSDVEVLVVWLVAAIVLHDGVLSPVLVGIGVALSKVPPRARRFVQFALIVGGTVAAVALGLVYRQGDAPVVKALLRRNYAANLGIVLALIAAVALLAYVVRVVLDRSGRADRVSVANGRPDGDVHSDSTS